MENCCIQITIIRCKIVQVKDMFLDIEKLKKLGFSHSISIEEGLLEVCQS